MKHTLTVSPTKFFGTVRQNIFSGKLWYYYAKKFFDTPNFLKHWRDAHEIFWHCETKNFRLKIVILPRPFPPPPLLSIIFFDARFFLIHRSERFPNEIFEHCETDIFWRKIVILPPPLPPLIHNFFSIPQIFLNKEGFPYEVFSVLWDNNFFL